MHIEIDPQWEEESVGERAGRQHDIGRADDASVRGHTGDPAAVRLNGEDLSFLQDGGAVCCRGTGESSSA